MLVRYEAPASRCHGAFDNPASRFFHLFTWWTLPEVSCTMVTSANELPVLRSPLRCNMKSYWIAATFLMVTAWPALKAYAIFAQQTSADSNPDQQAQSSSSSASLKDPVGASMAVDPAAPATSASVTAPAAAAPAKPKTSYMLVELSKTLKAKKLKVGD